MQISDLFSHIWDYISPVIIWAAGLLVIRWVASLTCHRYKRAYLLYSWHTIFAIIFYLSSLNSPTDAIGYYELSLLDPPNLSVGTNSVIILTHFASTFLALSFLSTSLVFNIIGSVGLVVFDSLLSLQYLASSSTIIRRSFGFLIFLPSLSLWTCSIGKDTLTFAALMAALYSISLARASYVTFVLSTLIVLLVRPHIALFLIFAFSISLLLSLGGKLQLKTLLFKCFVIVLGYYIFVIAAQYVNILDGFSPESVSLRIDSLQDTNMGGNYSFDWQGVSFAHRLFAFTFRPLFFDAGGPLALASSLENSLLLAFFGWAILSIITKPRAFFLRNITFIVSYASISWFFLSASLTNLGIAVRQKWMFLPYLILLACAILATPSRRLSQLKSNPPIT